MPGDRNPTATQTYKMFDCSIRLGVFLRRYPVARLFVLLYMVSLPVFLDRDVQFCRVLRQKCLFTGLAARLGDGRAAHLPARDSP